MQNINAILNAYQQGQIDKPSYIREMYREHHAGLFDYAQYLAKTNIKRIEIEDGRVIMTSRDRGIRMLCVPGDHRVVPLETLNFFDYEKSDSAMIERLILDGDVFFDIGANIGWYSLCVALTHRAAKIYSFEPIPKTYSYLESNIKLNHLANVTAFNFGFSDRRGQCDFYIYEEGSGNASSVNVSDREDIQVCQSELRTLDDFTADTRTKVDFIKCDVEGAELLVYRGGLQTIKRDKPIVFSEILRKWSTKFDYNPNEIFDLFHAQGYQAFTVKDGFLEVFSQMNEFTVETNFFFLHKQKHCQLINQFSK